VKKFVFSGRTAQSKAAAKRLKDAKKLRDCERWRVAMYLAGCAVE
jgi:hypothetical protein